MATIKDCSMEKFNDTHSLSDVADKFTKEFGSGAILVRSPGRVNLIGEHTDYNDGFVLPAAINKAVYIAIAPSGSDLCRIIALDLGEEYSSDINALVNREGHWSAYINGAIDQLKREGYIIPGFNCVLGGDIPTGAGMSSSAAVECGILFAFNNLLKLGIETIDLVKLGQRSENEYVGVQCGIMDQFASMFGKEGFVIKLDCRSLKYEYIPFDMKGIRIVLLDTNVKHSLAATEYNVRRQQCEQGVKMIKEFYPEVNSLRDATISMLNECVKDQDADTYDRCLYVIEEIERLQAACIDLEKDDIVAFGKKMFETHRGLSELYEVSCTELDFLVNSVKSEPAVLGARMMGGGFGGCTINLVKEDKIEGLVERLSATYQNEFGKAMKVYVTSIESGTEIINA